MPPTLQEVQTALSTVQEPELGRDLVSLGMIKDVEISGGKVAFKIELTTPACPLKDKIRGEAEAAVKALPGVTETDVQMTHRILAQKPVPGKEPVPGVANIVAVYACKGGVGKSTVAVNLAAALALDGCRVGLFDADVHGPDVPLMMGVRDGVVKSEGKKLIPVVAHGVKLMSWGFLSDESKPMIWRGPMVHGAIKQLLRDTLWEELDYLVVDLPPGTGDAQLTLAQTVPLAGVVAVTTPQAVSLLDGVKGTQMFQRLQVPLLGLVENMSGFVCPHCGKETDVFSKGGGEKEAARLKIPFLGAIPLDPAVAAAGDSGAPIVIGHPSSPQAKAFRWIAQIVAGRISVANAPAPVGGVPLESRVQVS